MEINTNRLILKDMTKADQGDLERIFNHPDFYYAYALQDGVAINVAATNYSQLAERTKLAIPRDSWIMSIIEKQSGKFIGAVVLVDLNQTQEYGLQAEIGYFIDVPYQGKGYASEAALAMKIFGKENLNIQSLYSTVDPNNSASWKILEKLGLKRQGFEKLSAYKNRDGSVAARCHYRGQI